MTPLRIALAAVIGTAIGASSAAPGSPPASVAPTATAVVVQAPAPTCPTTRRVSTDLAPSEASRRSASRAALPAAARRLEAQGADVTVVCDAASATAAVARAIAGHDAVLGSGPDVRAALSLAAADHPAQRFGPLPPR